MKSYIRLWKGIFDWKGRMSRGELLAAYLIHCLFYLAVQLLEIVYLRNRFGAGAIPDGSFGRTGISVLLAILTLLVFVPAVVRRLNDGGYSWRSLGWLLIPIFGWIAFGGRILDKSVEELPKKPKF